MFCSVLSLNIDMRKYFSCIEQEIFKRKNHWSLSVEKVLKHCSLTISFYVLSCGTIRSYLKTKVAIDVWTSLDLILLTAVEFSRQNANGKVQRISKVVCLQCKLVHVPDDTVYRYVTQQETSLYRMLLRDVFTHNTIRICGI